MTHGQLELGAGITPRPEVFSQFLNRLIEHQVSFGEQQQLFGDVRQALDELVTLRLQTRGEGVFASEALAGQFAREEFPRVLERFGLGDVPSGVSGVERVVSELAPAPFRTLEASFPGLGRAEAGNIVRGSFPSGSIAPVEGLVLFAEARNVLAGAPPVPVSAGLGAGAGLGFANTVSDLGPLPGFRERQLEPVHATPSPLAHEITFTPSLALGTPTQSQVGGGGELGVLLVGALVLAAFALVGRRK